MCIVDFAFIIDLGDNPESKTELVWSRCVDVYYKENPNPSRFTSITRSMFWPKDDAGLDAEGEGKGKKVKFPLLKGKGAEIKALMPALEWTWGNLMDPENPQHKEVLVALQCSVFMDKVLDDHRDADVLPKVVADQFKNAGFAMMSCYISLFNHFAKKGIALFNLIPKCHYLCHICLNAHWMHPRRSWCFTGEDFMRHVRRMWAMAKNGSTAAQAGVKVMTWYSKSMAMTLAL